MSQTLKIAYATPTDGQGTIYGVTYPHERACDTNVGWRYLRHLASLGYTVEIGASLVDAGGTLFPSGDYRAKGGR